MIETAIKDLDNLLLITALILYQFGNIDISCLENYFTSL